MRFSSVGKTVLFCLGLGVISVAAQQPPNRQIDPTVFPQIKPTDKLQWTDCYEVFKCARLSVSDVSVPAKVDGKGCTERVEIAIIRLPYKQADPSMPAQQLGTLHIQLGGWSSSNTNFLVRYGESYAPLFAGYELLAIDYRGHGWSTPSLTCFPDESSRQAFGLSEPALLGTPDKRTTTPPWVARAKTFASSCKKHAAKAARYGGSYAAAEDHVTVMKAMGNTKLSFWAISSGAIVAQTVAYKYPAVVDKFLLDAPAAAELAYGRDPWQSTIAQGYVLEDSSKGLDAFLYTCLNARPESPCSFANSNTTTLAQMKARFDKIEAALKTASRNGRGGLAVPGSTGPRKFTWSTFKYIESIALHSPGFFPVLGGVLSELEAGQFPPSGGWTSYAMSNVTYQPPQPLPMLTEDATFDGLLAGLCTDAQSSGGGSAGSFDAYYDALEAAAPAVSPVFGSWRLFCDAWSISPVNKYRGPFSAPTLSGGGSGKVVIVNNAAGDPASSIRNAERIKASIGGSVVVQTRAAGHTSFVTASGCFFKVANELFVQGIVPQDGLVCEEVFAPPFGVQIPASF
ncbi:uncharacterized protein B0I36DRAFT_297725 [Microdochium trichocladiopsis]|uniref:Uncharacterized protein n=1 Tax=Microdochium trichocladiopsis TaxID=1682393 RepID=A0A9P9BK72_9PEZI|nr:uncharacterized protein B0I36DRAFT_297725 [Microdochium trichocladiopsis]KAH7018181.1 hypothetical protein B0I36DRAFT_297725 [Microdochium trichocladiopsis]